jgi:prepilin-type N-terminal cleavage/methylation domain-containing protein
MYTLLQRHEARKHGDETQLGFTLIELLIVIVVLGVLAAVTVFALGGVTSQSAVSACNADAKTVDVAVAAYDAQTGYTSGQSGTVPAAPTSVNLVPSYLQSFPTSSHYTITLSTTGGVMVATTANTIATAYDSGTNPCIVAK